eukprot:jgi/Hompol1/96/HPOL_004489-RA
MQIRHLKSIIPSGDTANRVTALAWSPNNQKLAVVTADRAIQLFDETGERKDRFSTKPADPKLGLDWGEKKSICNKFIQNCEITCLCWPIEQHHALVFGLADGKVRIGNLKSNKAATLYQTDSMVVSAVSSIDGNAVMTGHLDGTINRFFFDDGISGASQGKFAMHKCPPTILLWGESVVAAGSDKIIVFYDADGHQIQQFDYSKNDDINELTVGEISPSGQSVVIGSYDR